MKVFDDTKVVCCKQGCLHSTAIEINMTKVSQIVSPIISHRAFYKRVVLPRQGGFDMGEFKKTPLLQAADDYT